MWQTKYPAFQKALKEAKTISNLDIETSMIDLACGSAYTEKIRYTIDPKTGTIIKVEKVRKQIPPSPIMLIFLAKNRMRNNYRKTLDKQEKIRYRALFGCLAGFML